MKTFIRNNGLSICFLLLFAGAMIGQIIFGFQENNKELIEDGSAAINLSSYLISGHFFQATFENWESEFLQMALFVIFTIFLMQKGSSESKDLDEEDEVDRIPSPIRTGAPWPVRKGGWILSLYKHSLSIALLFLFLISFLAHFYGSLKNENEHLSLQGLPLQSASDYIGDSGLNLFKIGKVNFYPFLPLSSFLFIYARMVRHNQNLLMLLICKLEHNNCKYKKIKSTLHLSL